jgi:predicted lactoylglutathione lyase
LPTVTDGSHGWRSHVSASADTAVAQEVALALEVAGRERVDELADAAVSAGGQASGEPQDEGFMYSRSFRDLDGHLWSVLHMPATA